MKTTDWSPQEDALLVEGHRLHGNKWSMLAGIIGGRWVNFLRCLASSWHAAVHWSRVMLELGIQLMLEQRSQ